MKNILSVAETFYSIQGEGYSMGAPSVFLRLAGCNLMCSGPSWVCDSVEVWKHGKSKLFAEVLSEDLVKQLCNGAHLVVTGGEPLLQQETLFRYLNWLCDWYGFRPFIEVETNGTIIPNSEMRAAVDQWNVSPKLSGVNEPFSKRVNEAALAVLSTMCDNAWFKIVISNEGEIFELLDTYNFLPPEKLILMPAGDTREKLDITRPMVVDAAKRLNARYSDRLHIVIWNQKTGV